VFPCRVGIIDRPWARDPGQNVQGLGAGTVSRVPDRYHRGHPRQFLPQGEGVYFPFGQDHVHRAPRIVQAIDRAPFHAARDA